MPLFNPMTAAGYHQMAMAQPRAPASSMGAFGSGFWGGPPAGAMLPGAQGPGGPGAGGTAGAVTNMPAADGGAALSGAGTTTVGPNGQPITTPIAPSPTSPVTQTAAVQPQVAPVAPGALSAARPMQPAVASAPQAAFGRIARPPGPFGGQGYLGDGALSSGYVQTRPNSALRTQIGR